MAKVTIKRTDLENMINESIQKYFDKINEISTDLKGAAAMRAAKNAKDEKNPSWKKQKYKTDINSELEENKSKKKELNENSIRAIVAEALKQVLSQRLNEEMDDFKPHGYCCDSNWGGKEIEISDSGDAARIRTNYGNGPSKPSEWCEIQYDFQDEDGNDMDDGRPYILVNGEKEYLDNYMKYI